MNDGNRRYRRPAAIMVLAMAAVMAIQPGLSAYADIDAERTKSETVYALLENDGTYSGATVVNCFTQTGEIVDYGAYTSIENLMGPDSPVVEGDQITWPASATDQSESFYYQGETQKALPFDIRITYYLNGEEVALEDAAGKTGELKIEFEIENNTGTGEIDTMAHREIYTPFAVQVSLTLDNTAFSIRDMPENATSILTGSSYTVSYSSFPLPVDTFSFALFGEDIALEPISIIALPKAPPGLDSYGDFVDVDGLSEGTDEMIDGTDDMQQGTGELLDGLYAMRDAAKALETGFSDLDDGVSGVASGADEIYQNACTLETSAGDFYTAFSSYAASFSMFDEGMESLDVNVTDMSASLEELAGAAALLDSGVIGMGDGLEGISASNAQLKALADIVAATYPDANTAALAAGLEAQQEAIDALAAAGIDLETLSDSVNTGTQDFYAAFSGDFCTSVHQLRGSSAALYASCLELLEGAYNIHAACAGLSSALYDLSAGADSLSDGTDDAADALPALIDAIDDMIDGVKALNDGLQTLNDDGLYELKDSLDGLEGYLSALSEKADEYGSFMDTRNAETSTVQFVLKTSGTEDASE